MTIHEENGIVYFDLLCERKGDEDMDDGGPTASIFLFFGLLLIDMFFYGFGSAILNLNMKEVEKRTKDEKDKKLIRLKKIAELPEQYVNTVQLIVTLVNVVMGSLYLGIWLSYIRKFLLRYVAEPAEKIPYGMEVLGVLIPCLTILILVYILLTFGVLFPKKIAAQFPEKWAFLCITPVYYITRILAPFTGLVSLTTDGILRILGIKNLDDGSDVTEEEIISMVNEGHEQGVLLANEAEMITNIFELGDKEAQDIMTHRNSIVGVDGRTALTEVIAFMLHENKSRFPVYEENIDHILGILHVRDVMKLYERHDLMSVPVDQIENLVREAVFIPETKNINDLFQMMQSSKTQMVIVVDEYGQTSGLVAMEDILEEIVGNIMDEYDEDEEHIEETGNEDEYIIDGMTPLEELEEKFEISFEEEEFETLNGFLISRLDRIPEENEEFDIDVDGYNFRILSVENKMIQSVLVTRLPRMEAEELEQEGQAG